MINISHAPTHCMNGNLSEIKLLVNAQLRADELSENLDAILLMLEALEEKQSHRAKKS